ncbi:hypothetical protein C8R43DRAFT_942555 [Mycena crocata]|nr:hypothetical protein C8R43DRAFT_942555 [Mycena crocata]
MSQSFDKVLEFTKMPFTYTTVAMNEPLSAEESAAISKMLVERKNISPCSNCNDRGMHFTQTRAMAPCKECELLLIKNCSSASLLKFWPFWIEVFELFRLKKGILRTGCAGISPEKEI